MGDDEVIQKAKISSPSFHCTILSKLSNCVGSNAVFSSLKPTPALQQDKHILHSSPCAEHSAYFTFFLVDLHIWWHHYFCFVKSREVTEHWELKQLAQMRAGAGTQTQPRVQSSLRKLPFLTQHHLACRHVGEINETDLNHYNLMGITL